MDDSILTSVKKLLGIPEDYDPFDKDVVMHINTVFFSLNQIGVGPPNGFVISDKTTTWGEYLTDSTNLEAVKSYIYLKVRLLFDPPISSIITESINRQITELEWRLSVAVK